MTYAVYTGDQPPASSVKDLNVDKAWNKQYLLKLETTLRLQKKLIQLVDSINNIYTLLYTTVQYQLIFREHVHLR